MGGRGSSSKISVGLHISMQYFGSSNPPIRLPKREYGKIIHEIDTMYNEKYSAGGNFYHYSGNYKYRIKVNGYNNYIITAKVRIK